MKKTLLISLIASVFSLKWSKMFFRKKIIFLLLLFISAANLCSAQSVNWLRSVGSTGVAEIRDLATDNNGNIYAIGSFNGSLSINGNSVISRGGYDVFISKYTAAGQLVWVKTVGGSSTDVGFQIETDSLGKVYATVAAFSNPLHVADSILNTNVSGILRFDSSGRFETIITAGNTFYDMKIYRNAIYARSQLNTLHKFALDGTVIWSKGISGNFLANNLTITTPQTSLEITPQGNIIFSQSCLGNYTYDGVTITSSSGRYAVASLVDTNSNLIRNYSIGVNQGFTLESRRAVLDENGNVYFAVNFPISYNNTFGSSTIQHLLSGTTFHAVLKFNQLAVPQWAFNVPCANSTSNFHDLVIDKSGNIAMLGMYRDITSLGNVSFPTNSFNGNIFTATINASGTLLKAMGFGTDNSTDRTNDIQVLSDSTLVFGGFTNSAPPVSYGCINAVVGGFMVMNYKYDPPPLPEVSFTQLREQRRVYFSSTVSNATNVSWNFGDGNTSTQRNPVHIYTTAGNFNVQLIGQNSCGSDTFSTNILYSGIQKILPEKIANNRFQVVVAKGGFPFTTAQMILKRGNNIILSESAFVTDSGVVQGNFLLHNEQIGMYDVIINSGSFTDTLYSSLVMEPELDAELTLQVAGPQIKLINRFHPYRITVSNQGNIHKYGVPVMIAIHPNIEIGRLSNHILADSITMVVRDSAFTHDFIKVYDDINDDSMWVSVLTLPVIAAGSSEMIEFYMKSTTVGEKMLAAALLPPYYDSAQLVSLGLQRPTTSCDFLSGPVQCILDVLNEFPGLACLTSSLSLGCAIGNVARDLGGSRNRSGDGKKYIADAFNLMGDIAGVLTCEAGGGAKERAKLVAEDAVMKYLLGAMGILAPALSGDVPNIPLRKLAGLPFALPGACVPINKIPKGGVQRLIFNDVSSMDPNDKTGPAGFTPENYFDGQSLMHYTIRFENLASATAPASEVFVYDTLDANFYDVRSLRFTGFGFADSSYQILNAKYSFAEEIDLRPSKNTILRFEAKLDTVSNSIAWKFQSLDPISRDWVPNIIDGFLNPNQTSPEGEGYVTFSILPLPNRPHLQQVLNKAKIVFDNNAPIVTPNWINTVDKEKPASHVLPLPALYNDTTFTIKWTGTDTHAGLAAYDIYAKLNDGPTYLLFRNATADSAILTGVFGNNYKFYSRASDHVGNLEDAPAVPDASITLAGPLPLDLLSFTAQKTTDQKRADLKWTTANEQQVSHFELLRSVEGINYTAIARIPAQNNPSGAIYTWQDATPLPKTNYYQLRMVDMDASFKLSQVRLLRFSNNNNILVFPTITNDFVYVQSDKQVMVELYNAAGVRLQVKTMNWNSSFDLRNLSAGIYLIRIPAENKIIKIIKQ